MMPNIEQQQQTKINYDAKYRTAATKKTTIIPNVGQQQK
jgi:hypothetical protein